MQNARTGVVIPSSHGDHFGDDVWFGEPRVNRQTAPSELGLPTEPALKKGTASTREPAQTVAILTMRDYLVGLCMMSERRFKIARTIEPCLGVLRDLIGNTKYDVSHP